MYLLWSRADNASGRLRRRHRWAEWMMYVCRRPPPKGSRKFSITLPIACWIWIQNTIPAVWSAKESALRSCALSISLSHSLTPRKCSFSTFRVLAAFLKALNGSLWCWKLTEKKGFSFFSRFTVSETVFQTQWMKSGGNGKASQCVGVLVLCVLCCVPCSSTLDEMDNGQ